MLISQSPILTPARDRIQSCIVQCLVFRSSLGQFRKSARKAVTGVDGGVLRSRIQFQHTFRFRTATTVPSTHWAPTHSCIYSMHTFRGKEHLSVPAIHSGSFTNCLAKPSITPLYSPLSKKLFQEVPNDLPLNIHHNCTLISH